MSEVVIRTDLLGKRYRLGASARYRTLRDRINGLAAAPWRALCRKRVVAPPERGDGTFWALENISFEARRGEVVGIIGRNGAGKSTLLKILSRITEPTAGAADLCGRVGSLLEVGTGFHPELSGRENIFLNGAILGMRRVEIARKLDAIVAFAEVDRFLDTPVKHYSSGMYTRLGFAVAAHLEPEILIVDEVLAVGDVEFQKKVLGKMSEIACAGRTVLFVSHNMHAINALCSRGLVLHRGHLVFDGEASAAVARYLQLGRAAGVPLAERARAGTGEWRFVEATSVRELYEPAEPREFHFRVEPAGPQAGAVYLSAHLVNEQGTTLSQFDSRLVGQWTPSAGPLTGRLRIAGIWLKPGRYALDLFLCTPSGIVDHVEAAVAFEVSPVLPYPLPASPDSTASALVLGDFAWELEPAAVHICR
jgi:lipopolysaccharide transport system ATP-binding protein